VREKDQGEKVRSCFKRLETDAEFRARMKAAGIWWDLSWSSERLDAEAWSARKMQRRIVEDVA
jgi:hypothetical protein